jgi:hypothetical protein
MSASERCTVCPECTTGQKSCQLHSMDLQGDVGQIESLFRSIWRVLISTQDRCMVSTERAIGSKIVFGASDGTPR